MVQDLVGERIANTAEKTRVGERTLQGVVLAPKSRLEILE